MSTNRILKLGLLADVTKFGQGMRAATADTNKFTGNVNKSSKSLVKAFAAVTLAAGAMALKIGTDAVKGAIEDEASQKKLAKALQNTTKATNKQIAAVEASILKQQLQFGIADTKLRPAFANLARATNSLTEAQKLQNLAIDVSAATGKDLETVSLALGKAFNGNAGALKKLGVPLNEAAVKSGDFAKIYGDLVKTFGGSALSATQTLAGQTAILKTTLSEVAETVGAKAIPKLLLLVETTQKVAKAFSTGDSNGLSARAQELRGNLDGSGAGNLGRSLLNIKQSFDNLFASLSSNNANGSVSLLTRLADALNLVASAINLVAGAIKKIRGFGSDVANSVIGKAVTNFVNAKPDGKRAMGGPVTSGGSYLVGERGPEILRMGSKSGSIIPNSAMRNGGNVVININGAVDANGTRRQLEQLFKNSSRQMGLVNLNGARL